MPRWVGVAVPPVALEPPAARSGRREATVNVPEASAVTSPVVPKPPPPGGPPDGLPEGAPDGIPDGAPDGIPPPPPGKPPPPPGTPPPSPPAAVSQPPVVDRIVTVEAANVLVPAFAAVGPVEGVEPVAAVLTLTQSPTARADEVVATRAVTVVFVV